MFSKRVAWGVFYFLMMSSICFSMLKSFSFRGNLPRLYYNKLNCCSVYWSSELNAIYSVDDDCLKRVFMSYEFECVFLYPV